MLYLIYVATNPNKLEQWLQGSVQYVEPCSTPFLHQKFSKTCCHLLVSPLAQPAEGKPVCASGRSEIAWCR